MSDVNLEFVARTVEQIGAGAENVLEILQAVQGEFGYLPVEALQRICELTEITPAAITGVSTFYDQFRHRPAGRYMVRVCIGTACHVKGGQQVYDAFQRHLRIPEGQDTDPDKLFTVEKVACLGCCMLAPVIQIEDVTYGHLTTEQVPAVLRDFLEQEKARERQEPPPKRPRAAAAYGEVRICTCSSCVAGGSAAVYEALKKAAEETVLPVLVKTVGCSGMSFLAPFVEVVTSGQARFRYAGVRAEDAKAILLRHFKPAKIKPKIKNAVSSVLDKILTDEAWEPVTRYSVDLRDRSAADFMGRQVHIATEHWGNIDPVDLDQYSDYHGFDALEKCVSRLRPDEIIARIKQSGLCGRGGAGFSTYLKWNAVYSEESPRKYIVCNGDEGDPGAFMDRMLMESYPYRILEGMAIAAYTVGAQIGFLYIRAEYPLAVERIRKAIEVCKERGLLGEKIFASDFSLELKIVPGAGAFVCGEETALMASIEGRRGMPRLRPPYPAQSGLWGKPTLINNVETYAAVPWIIRNGPEKFAQLGTGAGKGTKVFALAGKIARGGLIEVPMGISIRRIVDDIGGGIAGGLGFKAVQIGGPSGGCIPAELADIPVDYENLKDVGAMMGSGGLVVLDETDCMVDIARYFLDFTQKQSCGRCTFCRVGTRRMLDILERLCAGEGKTADIDELEHLAEIIKASSLCGLGKTAPNPVLSTIKYFRSEYEAHIEKRCPTGKCKALIKYSVTDECIGCTLCAQHCPAAAIDYKPYEKHEIDTEKCIRCNTCKNICPADAIIVE